VRVVLSSSGETAWVTAQEGNQVLAFRAASLTADPSGALLASTPVEGAPTGIALIENDRVVAVTNSNRFQAPNAPQTIAARCEQSAERSARASGNDSGWRLPARAQPREGRPNAPSD
jgi:hypothetical protein